VTEARLEDSEYGRYPTSDGWFVLNLGDALAERNEAKGGAYYPLEARDVRFPDFGVNVHVLSPGEPNGLYHAESGQEAFLVLSGECILVVEEEARTLRRWDFFHCPGGTRHIFVGAGEGPCAILMVGARPEDEELLYPMSEVAARYGASAAETTESPEAAYKDWPGDFVPARVPWPVE
jgi:uncharacterized cupin superfamily protein